MRLPGFSNRSWAWVLVVTSLVAVSVMGVVTALNSPPRTFSAGASGDTYVSSDAPTATHGTSTVIWVSRDAAGEDRILIQFNIFGRLRPGDLVVQATMRLTVSDASAASWPVLSLTGRTLSLWQENLTTFSTAPIVSFDTQTSALIGAERAPTPGTAVMIDVTKQMRRWHSYGGPSNFGTVVLMGPDVVNGAIGFASRDNAQFNKPVIDVTFQPSPRTIYGYVIGPGEVQLALPRFE